MAIHFLNHPVDLGIKLRNLFNRYPSHRSCLVLKPQFWLTAISWGKPGFLLSPPPIFGFPQPFAQLSSAYCICIFKVCYNNKYILQNSCKALKLCLQSYTFTLNYNLKCFVHFLLKVPSNPTIMSSHPLSWLSLYCPDCCVVPGGPCPRASLLFRQSLSYSVHISL